MPRAYFCPRENAAGGRVHVRVRRTRPRLLTGAAERCGSHTDECQDADLDTNWHMHSSRAPAIFLHDRHPRSAHPPKPTQLAWWRARVRKAHLWFPESERPSSHSMAGLSEIVENSSQSAGAENLRD